MSGFTQQQQQRRAERPPSAGPGGRSQGRGGSREFAPDPASIMQQQQQQQQPSQPYLFYSDVGSSQGMQQPSTSRAHSLGAGGSSGGVKLPAAGNYAAPAPKNDGPVSELRTALSREIEYRRQLEAEVAALKDSVSRVLAAQHRAALAAELEPDDASTVIAQPQQQQQQPQQPRGSRPRSSSHRSGGGRHHGSSGDRDRSDGRSERVHGSPGGSPSSSPPHSATGSLAGFPLAPVMPVSAKVAELEERMVDSNAEAAAKTAEIGQQITELLHAVEQIKATQAGSLSDSRALLAALEARLLSEAKSRDREQTTLHETHAQSLRALTSTLQALQSSMDHPPPSSLVATLQAQVLDHRAQLSALSTLTTSSTPRLIEKLTGQCDANAAALAKLAANQAEATATLVKRLDSMLSTQETLSSSVRALQSQLDCSASTPSPLQSRLQSHADAACGVLGARLHKLEDTVRSLPTPDPHTNPRINHLYIALDRVESQLENMGGKGGGGSTKRGSAAAAAAAPAAAASVASAAASAKTQELEDQMRLIRGAISQVDSKITESNALNASMHERMNTLDAGVAAGKKSAADLAVRVKTAAQAQRDQSERIEALTTAQNAVEARVNKVEAEARARDAREREKRKQSAEAAKDDAAAAAASNASGAGAAATALSSSVSSAAATGALASTAGIDPSDADGAAASGSNAGAVADPLRALVDDRIRRERTKVKTMFRSLEVAQTEATAALAALAARLEAMEAARKKTQATEDKRKVAAEEEATRAAEKLAAAVADLQSHSGLLSSMQSSVHALESKILAGLDESNTRARGDRLELQSLLDSQAKRIASVEITVAAASQGGGKSDAMADAAEAKAAAAAAAAAASLRSDLDAVITRSTQGWSLVNECNRVVSKLEANVTQMQLKIDEQAAAAATAAASAAAMVAAVPAGLDPAVTAELDSHRSRFSALLLDFERKSIEQSAFASSVAELRMRHDQLRREMELQENKLASQMAATTYMQQDLTLVASHVQCTLPAHRTLGDRSSASSSSGAGSGGSGSGGGSAPRVRSAGASHPVPSSAAASPAAAGSVAPAVSAPSAASVAPPHAPRVGVAPAAVRRPPAVLTAPAAALSNAVASAATTAGAPDDSLLQSPR